MVRLARLLLLAIFIWGFGSPAACAGGVVADYIVVLKSQRTMVLLADDLVIRSYQIGLGQVPLGPKRIEGDKRTPEGLYFVDGRNPRSRFHLSLHLSYPNAQDLERAKAAGVAPGHDIAIHGMPNEAQGDMVGAALAYGDWTDGCIAVNNRDMEEIWMLVPDGVTVEIRP